MSDPFESSLQKIKRKSIEQPWVPIGTFLTIGAFVGAYRKFKSGSKEQGVVLLRYRVAFQTLTVVGLLLGSVMSTGKGSQIVPAIKPVSSFEAYEEKK